MKNLIEQIEIGMKIKNKIFIESRKFHEAKYKKNAKKAADLREEITLLRRSFAEWLYKNKRAIITACEIELDKDKFAFCIMPPMGGPYFTGNVSSFHISQVSFGRLETILDSNIGHIDLLDNVCGFDNLTILFKLLMA